TYSAYNHPMLLVLFKWQTMLVPLLIILHLKSRRTQARPEIADVFLIAAVVFYLVYLLQHGSFNYRIIPSENFSFLALFAIAVLGPLMGGKGRACLAFGGFAVAAMLAIPIHRGPFKLDIARDLETVLTQYGPVSSVSVFSSYLWVGFPLVNLVDAQWASRF